MKLKLSNESLAELKRLEKGQFISVVDLIHLALAYATVEEEPRKPMIPVRKEPEPEPAPPQPDTPAGDVVRDFESWWDEHRVMTHLDAKSAAYFTWMDRSERRQPETKPEPTLLEDDDAFEGWVKSRNGVLLTSYRTCWRAALAWERGGRKKP